MEYRDNYLGFSYNGKSLSMKSEADFFGFIENNLEDLKFFNAPEFSNEFVIPRFGSRTIFTGTTESNRRFSLRIALYKINLDKYREFLNWLSPRSEGTLTFDFNPHYGYQVKLDSISESTFIVTQRRNDNRDYYYIDLDLNFVTTYDWAAKWLGEEAKFKPGVVTNLVDNEWLEPFVDLKGSTVDGSHTVYELEFRNFHKVENYFTVKFKGDLRIVKGTTTLVNIQAGTSEATYFSEYGIGVKANNEFVSGTLDVIGIDSYDENVTQIYKFRVLTAEISKFEIICVSREIL